LLTAAASLLLASCATSDTDVPFGLTPSTVASLATETTDFTGDTTNSAALATPAGEMQFLIEDGDPELPDAVAAAPELRPGSQPAETVAAQAFAEQQPASAAIAAAAPATVEEQGSAEGDLAEAQPDAIAPVQIAAAAPEPKKRGFLASLFAPQPERAPTQQQAARPLIDPARAAASPVAAASVPAQPIVQLTSAAPAAARTEGAALPGVRQTNLFEIKRRNGLDDDSDIDLHEDEEPYQVASAAGLARLAPNGLMKQHERVDVACLKPSLVRVLKTIENHYGRKAIVSSGYRSPDHNRRARGARNSLHMYCAAADIQVEGVSKWDLAQFVRTMPGRGGVGTYCHTESVHVDVGPERDWNWRCRRRK